MPNVLQSGSFDQGLSTPLLELLYSTLINTNQVVCVISLILRSVDPQYIFYYLIYWHDLDGSHY